MYSDDADVDDIVRQMLEVGVLELNEDHRASDGQPMVQLSFKGYVWGRSLYGFARGPYVGLDAASAEWDKLMDPKQERDE